MNPDDLKTWTVRSRFRCEDIVYLKVCDESKRGMITGITIRANGNLAYWVSWGSRTETCHFDCELTSEFMPAYQSDS